MREASVEERSAGEAGGPRAWWSRREMLVVIAALVLATVLWAVTGVVMLVVGLIGGHGVAIVLGALFAAGGAGLMLVLVGWWRRVVSVRAPDVATIPGVFGTTHDS